MRPIRRPGRTIAAASAVVVLFVLALAVPALAAGSSATTVNGHAVVRFQDYTLAQGQTVNSVVVIRGNAVIGGTVTRTVVVVAGDATIESTAVVGAGLTGQASSVVVVGGHLTVEPGATIHGKTIQVTGFHVGGVLRAALSNVVVRPVGVFAGWWQLLFLPIVALVVSALFPRTIRRVGDRVRLRFWPSLGWGIVGLVVAGVLLVVLAITIVGLIVVVPAGIALPAVLLFCFVGVAALLGRLVLSSSERYRDNIVVAGVVGAALVSLVSIVPVIGGLALFLATIAGFGAALALVNEWRQARRPSPAPAGGPLPPPQAGCTPPPPQAGWTPPPPQASGPPAGEAWATPASPPPPGWGPAADWTPPPGWVAPPGWQPPPEWGQAQGWPPPAAWPPPPGWVAPPGWAAPPRWAAPPPDPAPAAATPPPEEPSGETSPAGQPPAGPAPEETTTS